MNTKINFRFSVLLLFIVAVAALRYLQAGSGNPMTNFTPIGAMALFGGAYFTGRWQAWVLPLLTLFLSDMAVQGIVYNGQFGFPLYQGWYWVYIAFALAVLFGKLIIRTVNVKNIFLATVAASLTHWIVTDTGAWMGGCTDITTGLPFTKDFQGLVKAHVLALPYLKNFFLGAVFYSSILFGGFELAQRKYPALAAAGSK